jgi:hypothetical protein
MKKMMIIVLIGVCFFGCDNSKINIDSLDKVKVSWKEVPESVKTKLLEDDDEIYFLDDQDTKCEYENTSMIGAYKGDIEIRIGENTFWYSWNPKPLTPFVFEKGYLYYMYDSTGIGKPMFQDVETLKKFEVMKLDVTAYFIED